MADTFTKQKRSQIMKAVKSQGNKSTEIKLIKLFNEYRLNGWRRNYNLIGRPDFVFPKIRVVIFADGCFWHGHSCRNVIPKDNADYWSNKIGKNKLRDKFVTQKLRQKKWKVFRLWECKIKKGLLPIKLLSALKNKI